MTSATDYLRESSEMALKYPHDYIQNLDSVFITDEAVYVSREDFNKMSNYSATNPTGVYMFKCWKRAVDERRQGETDRWFFCWYGTLGDDGMVSINVRPLIFYTEENA